MGFLSEIPNFLAIFIPNVLLLVGFVLDSNENSIWLKNSIYFFAAFLFSAVTRKILPKISVFASNSSKETNIDLSFRQIIFPKKSRNLFRLIFTTFFTILHVILFEKSKGNSKLGNGIILIFIRFFCSISSNVFKSKKKFGFFIASVVVFISILIVGYSSNMQMIYLFLSLISCWFSLTYFKMLIPSLHNSAAVSTSVTLYSTFITFAIGVVVEKFNLNFNIMKAMLSGIFIYSAPHFALMSRKNNEKIAFLSYSILPVIVSFILQQFVVKNDPLPFVSLLTSIFIYISCVLATFKYSDFIRIHPFSTAKSSLSFIFTIFIIFTAIIQYILYLKSNTTWRLADCIYLIICINWTLSEVWKTISRKVTIQFSYGLGRISHIISFSLAILVVFLSIFVIKNVFFSFSSIKKLSQFYSFPSMLSHILLILYFIIHPRKKKSKAKSLVNAVNFNASKIEEQEQANQNTNTKKFNFLSYEIIDFIAPIFCYIGVLSSSIFIDKIVAIALTAMALYLTLPAFKESINALLCAVPNEMSENFKRTKKELQDVGFVVNIPQFSSWQNDAALSVGSAEIEINSSVLSKSQQFLMYVISKFQQIGIFDVTIELKESQEEGLPVYGSSASFSSIFSSKQIIEL